MTVNPLTIPGLSATGLVNDRFALKIDGCQAGPDYAVQSSTNLLGWSTLFITNFSSAPGLFQWTDLDTATLPAQFYRVKVGPPLP